MTDTRRLACPAGCGTPIAAWLWDKHMAREHVLCRCGWVGQQIIRHLQRCPGEEHGYVRRWTPGPTPKPLTPEQLQVENDRLAVELMRYNGVDFDDIEQIVAERDRLRREVARLREAMAAMLEASKFTNRAMALYLEADRNFS